MDEVVLFYRNVVDSKIVSLKSMAQKTEQKEVLDKRFS